MNRFISFIKLSFFVTFNDTFASAGSTRFDLRRSWKKLSVFAYKRLRLGANKASPSAIIRDLDSSLLVKIIDSDRSGCLSLSGDNSCALRATSLFPFDCSLVSS